MGRQSPFKLFFVMVKSVKIKNGGYLAGLLKDPIKLAVLVELAFLENEDGEAFYVVPKKWTQKFNELLEVGLVKKTNREGFFMVSGDFIQKPKKSQKKEQDLINNQLLAGDNVIIPQDLKTYYDIAISFQKLFYKNLRSINARTELVENAKFGKWITPIRLMFERDKITIEQIREVYKFLEKEQFWFYNCQSTAKLREKFNVIHSQANGKAKTGNADTGKNKVSTDYVKRVFDDLQS